MVRNMASPLAAPFAAAATGSVGSSVPVSQSTTTSDTSKAPQLTKAYNAPTKLQHYIDLAKHYATKYKWVIIAAVVLLGIWLFRSGGQQALCTNLGLACDTRPLPGGVREV